MRFFKICLILIAIVCFGGVSYFIYLILTERNNQNAPIIAYVCVALAYILSIFNLIYHYKSYRFYGKKQLETTHKKLPKLFWIGAIGFNSFLLFLFGVLADEVLSYYSYRRVYDVEQIIFLLFLIISGFVGFLELSLLKKRIKRLKAERDVKDEINDIGNQTV